MPIGGIIGGIGSLIGGLGASDAASQQAASAMQGLSLEKAAYQDIASKLLPFLQIGTTGANVLANNFYGINPAGGYNPNAPYLQPISSVVGAPPSPTDRNLVAQFVASPGYQYNLQQMTDAVQNSAAGKTGAVSGNMLRALQQNASGLASQDWNSFYNNLVNNYGLRYNDIANNRNSVTNLLQYLAGSGQNAAAQQGGIAQSLAQAGAGQLNLLGSANAAGSLGFGNALSNALNNPNLQNSLSSGINYLFGGGGGSDLSPTVYNATQGAYFNPYGDTGY